MKRELGTLSGADLGRAVSGPGHLGGRKVSGQATAVRHFLRPKRGGGGNVDHPMDAHERWTSVLVKVPTKPNQPDHREILLPSTEQIEVK